METKTKIKVSKRFTHIVLLGLSAASQIENGIYELDQDKIKEGRIRFETQIRTFEGPMNSIHEITDAFARLFKSYKQAQKFYKSSVVETKFYIPVLQEDFRGPKDGVYEISVLFIGDFWDVYGRQNPEDKLSYITSINKRKFSLKKPPKNFFDSRAKAEDKFKKIIIGESKKIMSGLNCRISNLKEELAKLESSLEVKSSGFRNLKKANYGEVLSIWVSNKDD